MRILMAEHFPIDHPLQVGSHHLRRLFVDRGHEVFWLADPVHLPKNPLRYWTDPLWRKSFDECRRGVVSHEGAKGLTPFTWLPWVKLPGLRDGQGPERSLCGCRPDPLKVLADHGFASVDMLWLTYPKWAALAEHVPHEILVHRITDDYEATSLFPSSISEVEAQLAGRADWVLSASRTMTERASKWNEKVAYMPNGVCLEDFQGEVPCPKEMNNVRGPKILYMGGVYRSRIDCAWIQALAQALPEGQIYLLGPGDLTRDDFGGRANIHLLGLVPYGELRSWAKHADVGLLPLPDDAFARAVNPLKILQYCAAGLPSVARDLPETRNLAAPVALASTAEDFVDAVHRTLAAAPKEATLVEFARKHSWSAWMDRFESLLEERS